MPIFLSCSKHEMRRACATTFAMSIGTQKTPSSPFGRKAAGGSGPILGTAAQNDPFSSVPEGSFGKRISSSGRIPGYRFPMGPLGETASQNSGSKRDMVSQTSLLRKIHPGIPARNGTHFPSRGPMGNCIPESAPKPGRSFRAGHQRQSCGGIVPAWAG